MRALIPSFIHDRYAERRLEGMFSGVALFLDITGFTPMSQQLMSAGSEGAELLSDIINQVFEPAVDAVHRHGGWVGKFIGDALLAFFPDDVEDAPLAALSVAEAIQRAFDRRPAFRTDHGIYELSARIGLAHGDISWRVVESPKQNTFYYRGSAITRSARAQESCPKGAVCMDAGFSRFLNDSVAVQTVGSECFRIAEMLPLRLPVSPPVPHPPQSSAVVERFIPRAVLEHRERGEFRNVVCLFVSFWGDSHDSERVNTLLTNQVIETLLSTTHRFGGYLSEIDFADKGPLALVYFGAPTGIERPIDHALAFASDVRREIGPTVPVRMGIAYGKVYAGMVGAPARSEYKAMGEIVNLAARLMTKAPAGSIWVSESVKRHAVSRFEFAYEGPIALKGFAESIPVYLLVGRAKQAEELRLGGEMIGRTHELRRLQHALEPVEEGSFGGIVYIDGPAGIGKTRLVREFEQIVDRERYTWFAMPSDEILRQSLNPLRYFARRYFGCSEDVPVETREMNFERVFSKLLEMTQVAEIRGELQRTKSFLGALVNLHWEGSLYESLDAKNRLENLFQAVKTLVKAESRRRPVIVVLEDCQWIDPGTTEFLTVLTQSVGSFPFILFAVSRLRDDGSEFRLPLPEVPTTSVRIQHLDGNGTNGLVAGLLGASVSHDLQRFLWEKSQGNPFFVEQLIFFLKERGAVVQRDDVFTLTEEKVELPSTIAAVIVARIDRLEAELRYLVKTASILGREFNIRVLSAMLKGERVETAIHEGEDVALWAPLSEILYVFSHALIRDAAYEMQLGATLRRFHLLAAETIEDLYRARLEPHYGELAYHFEKGEHSTKAKQYLCNAADQAETLYSNEEALDYYRRLRRYSEHEREGIQIDNKVGSLLGRLGRLDEAEELLRGSVESSRELDDSELVVATENALANVLTRKGAMDEARILFEHTLKLSTARGDKRGMSTAAGNIGRTYRIQGDFPMAMKYYRLDLRLCVEMRDRKGLGYTLGNMGSVYGSLGDYHRAGLCFSKALEICEEFHDKFGISMSEGSLGLVHLCLGEYEDARTCFQRQLEVAEELGDRYSISYSTGNLGYVHEKMGDEQRALECFQKKLEIAEEMGYKQGKSIALHDLGNVYARLNDTQRATRYLDEAIAIGRELKLMDYLCGYLHRKAEIILSGQEASVCDSLSEAESLNNEASEIAGRVGKHDVVFGTKVLAARIMAARGDIEASVEELSALDRHYPDQEKRAAVCYALAKITQDPDHRKTARDLYRQLFEKMPNHEFKRRTDEMK